MLQRLGLMYLVGIGVFFGNSALAVKFKQDTFIFTAKVNQLFKVDDLRSLLSEVGSGNLNWSIPQGKPAWLLLDSPNHKMSGTPGTNDLGKKVFNLFVQDGEQGAGAKTEITVIGPPEWKQPNIDLGIQNEGTAMPPFDLTKFVENPAGGTLTFSSPNLKAWMTLSADGKITGTPKRPDVGKYQDITIVATGPGGSAEAKAFGQVLKTIKEPEWKSNPIALEDVLEDSDFKRSIVEFVNNFEQTALTFEKVDGPAWLAVGSNGMLLGTPRKPDVGGVNLNVRFRTTIDGKEYTKTTLFQFKVVPVNHAPKWKANPLVLPNGFSKVLYTQDLSAAVVDIDGDKLTFTKISGPSWAEVSSSGTFSGTPQHADAGPHSFKVKVSDPSGLSDETEVQVRIVKSNEAPFWITKPLVLPKAKEDQSYMADLSSFAKDPDGDALTFSIVSGPAWAKLNGSVLSGTPRASDVGVGKWVIQVTDNITGSDTTDVLIEVEHVNHPPEWLLNPINITGKEKQPVSVNIAVYAKDVDKNDKLGFQLLVGGPAWGQLSADGQFTGTPGSADIGDNVFTVRVMDQTGASADTKLIVKVQNVNDKPYWTDNPVVLPNGKEGVAYSSSVSPFAKDEDPNDVLSFSKVSGPAWLMVNSDGSVSGNPKRADVGLNTFQVRVTDLAGEFALTTVQITIDKVNQAPRWRQNPILMTKGFEDKPYGFDLTQYAVDDDGDALTYSLVSGPGWMAVSASGQISGTPKKKDVGPFTAVFRVSDGQLTADATGQGEVEKTNHPPQACSEQPTYLVKERETLEATLTTCYTDPDGDTLKFTLANPPTWVTLDSAGNLTLKPLFAHIGDHMLTVAVSDGTLAIQGNVRVRVLRNPRPPVWLETPIPFEAKTNELFSNSVAGKAMDLDGLTLTFSKKAGKDWLTVKADGSLSGIPKDADLGMNTFTLSACNDALCAEALVVITVKPGTVKDITQIDKAVPGAPVENLWVIDTSNNCSELVRALRNNIKYYFEELNKAQIHHTGIYLSSDAHQWDGMPVKSQSDQWFLLWNNAGLISDFQYRMDRGEEFFLERDTRCGGGNCLNSPLWSMFRLYQRAPADFDFYHQGYFTSGIPMDALIVTQQRDHYKYYANNKPQKNWTPADYANSYLQFHDNEKQSFRTSAIAPECPGLITEESGWAGPENAYKTVVNKTRGKYYSVGNCNYNIKADLVDYAKSVIFRAYVHAKGKIQLSKKPMDISTIKVGVGGISLPGNSGASTDKWRYDSNTNEVILYWHLIDQGQLKPGDEVVIEYRVS